MKLKTLFLHLSVYFTLFILAVQVPLKADKAREINDDDIILIEAGARYQTIEGFGTSLINWENEVQELYDTEDFRDTYAYEMSLNMLRVNLWPEVLTDPVNESKDITHKIFNKEHEKIHFFMDFAQGLKKRNNEVKVIGTVYSPPGWMKYNNHTRDFKPGSINGESYVMDNGESSVNRVRERYFQHYAKYLLEWIRWWDEEGVGFYALSIANEPMHTKTSESCLWTAEHYAEIIALLGELLEEHGYGNVKLFGPETMTYANDTLENPLYLSEIMEHPEASQYFHIFSTHGYQDGVNPWLLPTDLVTVRNLVAPYNLDFWITKGNTGDHHWPSPIKDGIANHIHSAFVHGNVKAFFAWQITENTYNYGALMRKSVMTSKSYTFQQYARFIENGAIRIAAWPSETSVAASAYIHDKNQTLTIVLINHSNLDVAKTIKLSSIKNRDNKAQIYRTSSTENLQQLEDLEIINDLIQIELPKESVTTLYVNQIEAEDVTKQFLRVRNGSGEGFYPIGSTVTIEANTPDENQEFAEWRGDTAHIEDIYSPITTLTIPEFDVNIRAFYANLPQDDTHLAEMSSAIISIFPNPATGNLLNISSDMPLQKIVLYSLTGIAIVNTEIQLQTETVLDISGMPKGYYVLQLHTLNNEVVMKKFIKR